MIFTFRTRRHRMVPLLCGMLLLLQIAGTHLHLCFDGQEPPVTVHLLDGGLEHVQGGAAQGHLDENIDNGKVSVAKNSTVDVDLAPVLFVAFLLCAVLPRLRLPRDRRNLLPAFYVLTYLRPPLRGPPATTFT